MSKVTNPSSGLTQDSTVPRFDLGAMPLGLSSKRSSKKPKTLGEFGEFVIVQPYEIGILVITDRDQFVELNRTLTGEDEDQLEFADGLSQVYDHPSLGHLLVMLIPKKYCEVTVWHEALHMVHFISEIVGVEVSNTHSSSEMQAYTQGHIVQMVQEACFPKPKRKKAPKKGAKVSR